MTIDSGVQFDNVQGHEIPAAGRITYIKNGDGTFSPATAAAAGGLNVVATAVAPTLVEGSSVSLSSDLSGQLRIGGTISASSSAKATTAAPSYVNNTDNPFSQNLTGDLRTIAKQSGAWVFSIDQSVNGTTNAVDVNNLPTTLDVNTGNASNSTIRVAIASNNPALAVTGTFWQATQPVSFTMPALVAGAALIGKVGIDQTTPGTTDSVTVAVGQGLGLNFGLKADAKNAATDTTAITAMSVWKQISFSIQAIATAIVATLSTKEIRSATCNRTSVVGSASSGTILALNTNRLGAGVYNDSTAILYLDESGGTATSANYTVQMGPGDYYEVPAGFTGLITGIWASATGAAKVKEFV